MRTIDELDGRVCSRCKMWRLREEMVKNSAIKDGMNSWCKECTNKRNKEIYEGRKFKGLCIYCSQPHADGSAYCKKHLISNNLRSWRGIHRSKGLCLSCSQPHAEDSVYCEDHNIKNSLREKERRNSHRNEGLCIHCSQPHVDDSVYCSAHLIENNNNGKNHRDLYKEKNLCQKCGQPKEMNKGNYCLRCAISNRFSTMIRSTLSSKNKSKNSKSWVAFVDYTKEDLIQHVDHWKNIQGLNGDFMEIHHINYRSKSQWQEPGDPEWRKLWFLSNLLPLTMSSHDAVHREDYTSLHPEVRRHILKMRGRDDVSMSEMP